MKSESLKTLRIEFEPCQIPVLEVNGERLESFTSQFSLSYEDGKLCLLITQDRRFKTDVFKREENY